MTEFWKAPAVTVTDCLRKSQQFHDKMFSDNAKMEETSTTTGCVFAVNFVTNYV